MSARVDATGLSARRSSCSGRSERGLSRSSISTLIEFDDVRLLLGADAHPDTLLDGIKRLSPPSPRKVDVWKLPHHGSAANVTDELLAAVDAKAVVFSSNGAYFSHSDMVAVARVIRRYQRSGVHPKAVAACMAARLTAAEMQKCANGIGSSGGCFGPNNTIRKTVENAVSNITRGPGPNNELCKIGLCR